MEYKPASRSTSPSRSSALQHVFSKSRNNRKSKSRASRSSGTGSIGGGSTEEDKKGFRASIEGAIDKLKHREDDADSNSGSSALKKFAPKGFESRRRRRQREEEQRELEEIARGRSVAERGTLENEKLSNERLESFSSSTSNLKNGNGSGDGDSMLSNLTYDSETESERPAATPPPLSTHPSHIGYLTTSSPLIQSSTLPDIGQLDGALTAGTNSFTTDTVAHSESTPTLVSDNLQPPKDGSQKRSPSPVGRLKEVFKPRRSSSFNNNTSPDRKAGIAGEDLHLNTKDGGADSRRGSVAARVGSIFSDKPLPQGKLRSTASSPERPTGKIQAIDTSAPPRTPPSAENPAPIIVNTPPTPTDSSSPRFSNTSNPSSPILANNPNVVRSPSGNMISHRRIRSGSATLGPSKLSNITSAPLTPTPENGTTTPGQGGFFSSVFSAAQNAANTLSSSIANTSVAPGGTRNRSGTPQDPNTIESPEVESIGEKTDSENPMEEKELAVKTLGMGDLSLSHLGISEAPSEVNTPTASKFPEDMRSRLEVKEDDKLTERASTAPGVLTGENLDSLSTPQVEDLHAVVRARSNYEPSTAGDNTPPNGSLFEGKSGIHRSGSIRSAINHRKRGSSAATGTTIGAAIAAANSSIASPSQGQPKITGFAVASKKRNRDFHQLFRSVPDDDYLIEDYSCALQREILAHGRLYVSEGHLCFSSNIFGWVTTLVMSFDEIISVEKRSTALLFKNGLMISTLHAKNVFASFTSRDSTYDLIVGIWKIGHPNLRSSLNGVTLEETGGGDKTEKDDGATPPSRPGSISQESSDESDDNGDIYDEDEDDEDGMSFTQADASVAGSELGEKVVSRKPSGVVTNGASGEANKENAPTVAADFPGPATHAPTNCADGDTHYAKVLADEVIPAPLGKVYSLMFGQASLTWMRNWLTAEQKCLELTMDDKNPLGLDNRVRNYSYIKPLNGAIGPKQTKCVCTETLDALDYEKAVSVTISTATPDVPSGNVFSTKTKYCLSWSEGNGTRLQMNCAIEWTGKSWLKGPIEKGANDGQVQYAKDIIASLKAAVGTRRSTVGSASKGKKKARKGRQVTNLSKSTDGSADSKPEAADWGLFEPVRSIFEPFVDMVKPIMTGNILYGLLVGLLVASWFRFGFPIGVSSSRDMGLGYLGTPERVAAYEEIWRREESELWLWLEERAGMDRLREVGKMPIERLDLEDRLKSDGMEDREVERAIKVTEEKLRVLKDVVEKKKEKKNAPSPPATNSS